MARSLHKLLAKIEKVDPARAKRYSTFYEGVRGRIPLSLLGTGSWRKTIEILDLYDRTGHVLERDRSVVDMFETWSAGEPSEVGICPEETPMRLEEN